MSANILSRLVKRFSTKAPPPVEVHPPSEPCSSSSTNPPLSSSLPPLPLSSFAPYNIASSSAGLLPSLQDTAPSSISPQPRTIFAMMGPCTFKQGTLVCNCTSGSCTSEIGALMSQGSCQNCGHSMSIHSDYGKSIASTSSLLHLLTEHQILLLPLCLNSFPSLLDVPSEKTPHASFFSSSVGSKWSMFGEHPLVARRSCPSYSTHMCSKLIQSIHLYTLLGWTEAGAAPRNSYGMSTCA
jgi:hypothetical protein